ncbi:CD63 antigen [Thelohanellus kitauei]|uniref:CD63 antigen n=1 Tax=Thelohanellus kitauei TaxID=669202 RepID=A0A0C2IA71_THEKT|nr:CD63 antigen [Thelohanellus kitauei]
MSVRILTFFILFIFLIISFTVGITALVVQLLGTDFCPQVVKYRVIVVICVLASVVGLSHLFGILGVCFRWRSSKFIYLSVFVTLLIVASVFTVIFFVKLDDIKDSLLECTTFKFDLSRYGNNNFINRIQRDKKCCGFTSIDNWAGNKYPPSCCEDQSQACTSPFEKPCHPYLIVWLPWIMIGLAGALVGLIFLSPIGIVGIIYSKE